MAVASGSHRGYMHAPRSPDVYIAEASRTVAGKEQQMFVAGQRRNEFLGRSIDDDAEVRRWSPRAVLRRPLRKPDVCASKASRAIRSEVETEAVFGDRGAEVIAGAVDYQTKVRWRSPSRELRRRCTRLRCDRATRTRLNAAQEGDLPARIAALYHHRRERRDRTN